LLSLRQLCVRSSVLTGLRFADAAKVWLETRKPYLSPKTIHEYGLNIRTLTAFFGEMELAEISGDQIRAYQQMRLKICGPFAINHECSVLQQMLKRIGRWPELATEYQALPLPKEKRGRVLRDEQRVKLLQVAKSNPNWEAAYLFTVISVNTSAGPKETATLRLKDVDLERRLLQIQPEGAKNVHRIRGIPLNAEAMAGVEQALRRAKSLGSVEPEHYLFPFRIHRAKFDPTRHQTTFKTAWRRLIVAAGIPGFRAYDLRHHAITVLLENPKVSEETAESIAGQISREMKKRYTHVRLEAQRQAVEALSATKKPSSKSLKSESEDVDLARDFLKAIGSLLKSAKVS